MTSHRLLPESSIPVVLPSGKVHFQASVLMLSPDPLRGLSPLPHFIDEETKSIVHSSFLIWLKAETVSITSPPATGRVPGEGKEPLSLRAGPMSQGHCDGMCLLGAWLCAECFSQMVSLRQPLAGGIINFKRELRAQRLSNLPKVTQQYQIQVQICLSRSLCS